MVEIGPLVRWRDVQFPEPAWLDPSESRRLAGFSTASRRQQFLAGRWQARHLLAQHLNVDDIAALCLEISEQGASSVPAYPALGLSISHSGDWLGCAIAHGPIGLDIEVLRPRKNLLTLASTVLAKAECEALAALDAEARTLHFYQAWTLREAWLKRRGQGLDIARMRSLRYGEIGAEREAQALCLLDASKRVVIAVDGEKLDTARWPASLALVRRLRYLAAEPAAE